MAHRHRQPGLVRELLQPELEPPGGRPVTPPAKFEFAKAIYAPTLAEWEILVANNPFHDFEEGKHVHAAVLDGMPTQDAVEALRAHAVEGEAIQLVGGVVYPNMIPLGPKSLRQVAAALKPLKFDRLYGAFPGQLIKSCAGAAVARSAERYLKMIGA